MKLIEIMEMLNKGKKVRQNCWREYAYVYKNEDGYIVWYDERIFCGLGGFNLHNDDWVLYEEDELEEK